MVPVFEQLAPLLLLVINESILPIVLKYFAQWEGNVSAAMLEASLFVKLGWFMVRSIGICGGLRFERSELKCSCFSFLPRSFKHFLFLPLVVESWYVSVLS